MNRSMIAVMVLGAGVWGSIPGSAAGQLRFSDDSPAGVEVTPAATATPAAEAGVWSPRKGQLFPDLTIVLPDGTETRLTRWQNRAILIEYVAMPSPVSQALAGGNRRGPLGEQARSDVDVLEFAEVLPFFAKGVEFDPEEWVHVALLVAGPEGGAPTAADARAWAQHFGIDVKQGRIVAAASTATLERGVRNFAPGFHLLDKRFVVQAVGTSGDIAERLRLDVLPALADALGKGKESADSGSLKITLDDVRSLEPWPELEPEQATMDPTTGRIVTPKADIEPGRMIQPVTMRTMEPIIRQERKLVMVYVFSTRSAASRQIWPIAGMMTVNNAGKVRSLRLDVEHDREAVGALKLEYVPTFLFYRNGKEVGRVTGQFSPEDVQKVIDANAS
jgi:thioredoxin 1